MYLIVYPATHDDPEECSLHESYLGELNHLIAEAMVNEQDVVHSITAIDDADEEDITIDVLEMLTPLEYSCLTELFSTGIDVDYHQVMACLTENRG